MGPALSNDVGAVATLWQLQAGGASLPLPTPPTAPLVFSLTRGGGVTLVLGEASRVSCGADGAWGWEWEGPAWMVPRVRDHVHTASKEMVHFASEKQVLSPCPSCSAFRACPATHCIGRIMSPQPGGPVPSWCLSVFRRGAAGVPPPPRDLLQFSLPPSLGPPSLPPPLKQVPAPPPSGTHEPRARGMRSDHLAIPFPFGWRVKCSGALPNSSVAVIPTCPPQHPFRLAGSQTP